MRLPHIPCILHMWHHLFPGWLLPALPELSQVVREIFEATSIWCHVVLLRTLHACIMRVILIGIQKGLAGVPQTRDCSLVR